MKIIKNPIFMFILGIALTLTIVTVYAVNANSITYRNGTVKDALDELYQNSGSVIGTEYVQLTNKNTYQLPVFPAGYTWVSTDANAIQVGSNGLANISASADVYLEKDNKKYFKFSFDYRGPVITLLSGKYYSNNTSAIDATNAPAKLDALLELLTDGNKTQIGYYDALWISHTHAYDFLKFSISRPIDITFSSGRYSDSGGSSGKTANFYKLDGSGNEVLYTSFVQQNNAQDYHTEHFEPGTYILRAAENYILFSEWTITEE